MNASALRGRLGFAPTLALPRRRGRGASIVLTLPPFPPTGEWLGSRAGALCSYPPPLAGEGEGGGENG